MRTRLAILLIAATGCTGGDHDDPAPTPIAAKIVVTGPTNIVEEVPATYAIAVLTSNDEPTAWSGTIDVASLNGPVTPAAVVVSNGSAVASFTLELAGSALPLGLVFSAPSLEGFTRYLDIAARVPLPVEGPVAGGSVLAPSASAWDRDGVWAPSVWQDGAELRMLYASSTTGGAPHVGLAVSTDGGMTWNRGAMPVLGPAVSASACHTDGAENPAVFVRGDATLGAVYLGREGTARRLCFATSSNGGATWTPVAGAEASGSVVDTSSASFENVGLRSASIIRRDDGVLEMLYAAEGTDDVNVMEPGPETIAGVGLARSSDDGLTWSKVAGPNFGAMLASYFPTPSASTWEAYEQSFPSVQKDGPVYRAYLTGLAPGGHRIGLYETLDLAEWVAHVDNLLSEPYHEMIGLGATGRFDENGAMLPSVLEVAGVRTVFYTGIAADGIRRIGVARCE